MRIAVASTFLYSDTGGAGISTRLLLSHLASQHELVAITASSGSSDQWQTREIRGFARLPRPTFLLDLPMLERVAEAEIYRILGNERPDVVHIQDFDLLPPALRAARRRGLPVVVTVRDHRFACNLMACHAGGRAEVHDADGYRDCLRESAALVTGRAWPGELMRPLLQYRPERLRECLNQTDAVIAVSNYMKMSLMRAGIDPVKIRTVYNLAPTWREDARMPGGKTFLAAGRLERAKGFEILLDAFAAARAQDRELGLVIVGDGMDAQRLRRRAAEPDIADTVQFAGRVAPELMADWYARTDFAVLPSIYPEPLSRMIWESFSVGRPLLATRTGGTPEVVKDGVNGLLAEANPAALARGMLRLAGDRDLQERLVRNQKVTVRDHNPIMTAQHEELYRRLAGVPDRDDSGTGTTLRRAVGQ
jgi:glycosyltransferase involved in cell wall biosynthesis